METYGLHQYPGRLFIVEGVDGGRAHGDEVGRDFGDRLEVVNGLHQGDMIIENPGDTAREGVKVNPVTISELGR